MEIKINLSNEEIERILYKSGYIRERVKLWTLTSSFNPYGIEDMYGDGSRVPIEHDIVYRNGERPESLLGESPTFEDHSQYLYNTVVVALFKERLLNLMFDF